VHDRAHALGLSAPFAPKDFIAIHGGVIEPSREGRVAWAPDTAEAALKLDQAQAAFEAASNAHSEILAGLSERQRKARRLEGSERAAEMQRVASLKSEARVEYEESFDRLRAARRRHSELVQRDSRVHSQTLMREDRDRQATQREAAKKAARDERRGVVARLTRSR
jgi:hypothetical protein